MFLAETGNFIFHAFFVRDVGHNLFDGLDWISDYYYSLISKQIRQLQDTEISRARRRRMEYGEAD